MSCSWTISGRRKLRATKSNNNKTNAMRTKRQLQYMYPSDPNMREVIGSLWREFYALYSEKYKYYDTYDQNGQPIDPWIPNYVGQRIEFGQAFGQDNRVFGNKSIAIGMANITAQMMEIVMGTYSDIPVPLDASGSGSGMGSGGDSLQETFRLLTLGNGTSDQARSNALVVFRSGLTKLINAIKLGAYSHPGVPPEEGMLQYLENQLQLYFDNAWHTLLGDAPQNTNSYVRQNGNWIVLPEGHPPLSISPACADLASVDANQVLTIIPQAQHPALTISPASAAIASVDSNQVLTITLPAQVQVTASNGLTRTGDNIQLGGALLQDTVIGRNGSWGDGNNKYIDFSKNQMYDTMTYGVNQPLTGISEGMIATEDYFTVVDTGTAKSAIKNALVYAQDSAGNNWQAFDTMKVSSPGTGFDIGYAGVERTLGIELYPNVGNYIRYAIDFGKWVGNVGTDPCFGNLSVSKGNDRVDVGFPLPVPETGWKGYILPISVNGQYASNTGNIALTIPSGHTPVSIAPASAGMASIDANQQLTITPQSFTDNYVDAITISAGALLTLGRTGALPDLSAQFGTIATRNFWTGTLAQYTAIAVKDANTNYYVQEP